MTTETTRPVAERRKLTIVEVKEPQKIGTRGLEKLGFKAKGEDGKELLYYTFRTTLFEPIKAAEGKELEADVEISSRDVDGNIYIDRKVTQVYAGDGQPVVQPQDGRSFARTSILARVDNSRSIERQVALKEAGEWIRSGKDVPGEIVEKYTSVIAGLLSTFENAVQGEMQAIKVPSAGAAVSAVAETPHRNGNADLDTRWKDFVNLCTARGISQAAILRKIGEKGLSIPFAGGKPDLSKTPVGITAAMISEWTKLVKSARSTSQSSASQN